MANQWYWPDALGDDGFASGPSGTAYSPHTFIYGSGRIAINETGTATKIAVRCTSASGTPTLKLGLYDSGGNLLAQGTVVNGASPEWREATISAAIHAGTYTVRVSSETTNSQYYYSTSGHGMGDAGNYADAMPATISLTEDETGTLFGVKVFVEGAGYPLVAASATTNGTTLSGGVALTMPSGIVAGNLLIAWAANDNTGGTNMAISGWTQLFHSQVPGNVASHGAWAKIAAGSDTATLTGAAQDFAAVVVRITEHGVSDIATDLKVATPQIGLNINPNPPSLDAGSSKKWLWIESFGAEDDDETATYWSTNYLGIRQIESAQSANSCMTAVAYRHAEAQIEDPGVMAMAAAEDYIAGTLAIPPVAAAGPQTLTASALTAALSAVGAVLVAGAVTLAAGAQVLGLSAPAATLAASAVLATGSQAVGLSPPVATLAPGPATVTASPPVAALSAPTATSVASAVSLGAGAQGTAIAAPTATPSAGAVTLAAGVGACAVSAPAASVGQGGGPTALTATAQALALVAPAATPSVGPVALAAGAQGLGVSAPAAIPAAAVTLAAGGQTAALSAPAAVLDTSLVRVAGAQTLAVSAPAATAVPGATTLAASAPALATVAPVATTTGTVTILAGPQGLAVSAPAAAVNTSLVRIATAQTLAVSAPVASVVAGATTVTAATPNLALSAPAATAAPGSVALGASAASLAVSAPPAALSTAVFGEILTTTVEGTPRVFTVTTTPVARTVTGITNTRTVTFEG